MPWALSFSMTQHRRPCQICRAFRATKKARCAGLFVTGIGAVSRGGDADGCTGESAPWREPNRLQFDIRDAGRDIEPGLALQADRLQRVGILRTADQEIAAAADTDRRVGADAAIVAGEFAAAKPAGRRVHRPGELGLLGDAEIEAEPAHGRDIGFGTAAFDSEIRIRGWSPSRRRSRYSGRPGIAGCRHEPAASRRRLRSSATSEAMAIPRVEQSHEFDLRSEN